VDNEQFENGKGHHPVRKVAMVATMASIVAAGVAAARSQKVRDMRMSKSEAVTE
jgi:hypothetical protein